MAATYKLYKNPPKAGEAGKQELQHAVMEGLHIFIAAEKNGET